MSRVGKSIKAFILMILVITVTVLAPVTVMAEDVSVVNSTMLSDMNALRASQGLGSLSLDANLCSIAAVRAQEAATTWSHTRPNGQQGVTMLPSDKWRGENLSYVQYGAFTFTPAEQTSAAELMYANLKASPTHYRNMVLDKFTKVGIATYVSQTPSGIKLTTAYMFTN